MIHIDITLIFLTDIWVDQKCKKMRMLQNRQPNT